MTQNTVHFHQKWPISNSLFGTDESKEFLVICSQDSENWQEMQPVNASSIASTIARTIVKLFIAIPRILWEFHFIHFYPPWSILIQVEILLDQKSF